MKKWSKLTPCWTPPSPPPTEVIPTDKVEVGFKDIDAAILVGSMPRKEGMERKDLLKANVAIFKTQGTALDKYAKKTVKVTPQSWSWSVSDEPVCEKFIVLCLGAFRDF